MRETEDRALMTAREMVTGAICECGHLDAEHVFADGAAVCDGRLGDGCEDHCRTFRPVVFTVARARERVRR